jgi:hypothetical protein
VAGDDPISDSELHAMQKRADAASKGPWTAFIEGPDDSFSSFIQVGGIDDEPDMYLSRDVTTDSAADLNFIAAARQDVPRLIAEVKRMRRELDRVKGGNQTAANRHDRDRSGGEAGSH